MPLPQAIIDRADSDLAELDAQLSDGGKQDEVLAAEGKYLQIISGMTELPKDGEVEAVDDTAKPLDRLTSPADNNIIRQTNSTVSTCVDEYCSKNGRGWGYRQEVIISGKIWLRTQWVVNPGNQSELPWTEVLDV